MLVAINYPHDIMHLFNGLYTAIVDDLLIIFVYFIAILFTEVNYSRYPNTAKTQFIMASRLNHLNINKTPQTTSNY